MKTITLLIIIAMTIISTESKADTILKQQAGSKNHKGKLLVITNRTFTNGDIPFNHETDSMNRLSFLTANRVKGNWELELKSNFSELTEELDISQNLVFFVHGDGKTFEATLERALDIKELYNTNVLLFSWPSKAPGINGIKNFRNSRSNVEKGTKNFTEILKMFESEKSKPDNKLDQINNTLFLHSLGNYYLQQMVEQGLHKEIKSNLFDNIVINAAAVDYEGHDNWVDQITFGERIYITSNKKDMNLNGAKLFITSTRQLGAMIEKALSRKASYIHFTDLVGLRLKAGVNHTYFLGKVPRKIENVKKVYTQLLHGFDLRLKENKLFAQKPDGLSYELTD